MPKKAVAVLDRRIRMFGNQALPGADAVIRKEGERLIIEPTPPKSLLAVLATLEPVAEHFPTVRDLHPDPVDL